MTPIKLSKRLSTIASLIPSQGGVADVGTDHGYIPVWLCQNGHTGRIVATDINEGPLGHAIDTAVQYGFADDISFFICDGLCGVCDTGLDTIVIAGMGGETIIDILSAALWTAQPGKHLILQPMTKSDLLRKWLYSNWYKVEKELLVEDDRTYEIIVATGGQDSPTSPAELLTGRLELIREDPLFPARLEDLIHKTERAVNGLESSKKDGDEKRLAAQREILSELYETKGVITLEKEI